MPVCLPGLYVTWSRGRSPVFFCFLHSWSPTASLLRISTWPTWLLDSWSSIQYLIYPVTRLTLGKWLLCFFGSLCFLTYSPVLQSSPCLLFKLRLGIFQVILCLNSSSLTALCHTEWICQHWRLSYVNLNIVSKCINLRLLRLISSPVSVSLGSSTVYAGLSRGLRWVRNLVKNYSVQ